MTPAQASAILAERDRRAALAGLTLERVVTDPEYCGLPASDLQVAITRAADGAPIGAALSEADQREFFGMVVEPLWRTLVVLVCGVRSGKSLLASCAAIKGCLTADLSRLQKHEIPRYAIVAPTVDNANATFVMLRGIVKSSRRLNQVLVKEPTSDTIVMRRPDGRVVEIVVVAAHRGAVTMRSRWLIGFCLEEVALFGEQVSGAVVTAEEILRAAASRLVPGSQGWIISSPFGPQGLLYELWREHFGKQGTTMVVRAPTERMHPPDAGLRAIIEALRLRDPDAASREYDAMWLEASSNLIDGALLDAAMPGWTSLPREDRHHYFAGMDPATRSNAWTLAIATRRQLQIGAESFSFDTIVYVRQWQGSKSEPLDPRVVFTEMAADLRKYGLDQVWSDDHGTEFAKALASNAGIRMATSKVDDDDYLTLALKCSANALQLPKDPALRSDLRALKKLGKQGKVRVQLPQTADGRHCDYAPAVVRALARVRDPDPAPTWGDEGERLMQAAMDEQNKTPNERFPVFEAPRIARVG